MVSLNTKQLKQGAEIQKNVLYRIDEDRIIPIREKHKDCADVEIVNLEYTLKEGQYAVVGKEYKSPTVKKDQYKSTDILTCLIDDNNKKIYSLILDIKKNISAFSDDLLKDSALLSAINEVSDFIEQLHHAMLHKESSLLYSRDDGYTETAEVGIATRNFEKEKFLEVADFLERLPEYEKSSNVQSLVWYNFKKNLMPYMSKAEKIRDFANQKVTICNSLYQLHVYLLEKINELEYAVSIEIKLDNK